MAARGQGRVAVRRDKNCPACGSNEWRKRKSGGWTCRECDRQAARRNKQARRADPAWSLWESAKVRAGHQMVPFLLSVEDIRNVWPRDGYCPALGLALRPGSGFSHDASPTLDRLNPEWGYEPGNIAVISMRANRAKNGLAAYELQRIADWMRLNGME